MNYIKLYIILYCEWDFWRLQDDETSDDSEKDDEIGDDSEKEEEISDDSEKDDAIGEDSDDETSNHSVHLYNVRVLN